MLRKFTIGFHIPGTLAADIAAVFAVPSPCTLVHVSAGSSNDSDALLEIGTVADPDAHLESCVIGDTEVPVESTRLDFVGDEFPRFDEAGDVIKVSLDHDGAVGTAAQDATLVLTFVEG